MKACIVGAPSKLGQYLAQHAPDRGYEVAGACKPSPITIATTATAYHGVTA